MVCFVDLTCLIILLLFVVCLFTTIFAWCFGWCVVLVIVVSLGCVCLMVLYDEICLFV